MRNVSYPTTVNRVFKLKKGEKEYDQPTKIFPSMFAVYSIVYMLRFICFSSLCDYYFSSCFFFISLVLSVLFAIVVDKLLFLLLYEAVFAAQDMFLLAIYKPS